MKKIIPILSVLLTLFIAGCTSTQASTVVGNKTVIHQIKQLSDLSNDNATTVEMLLPLQQQTESDPYVLDLVNKAIWLTKYKEYEHSGHSLAFLLFYLSDGTKILCPGHELEHIDLYVKHDDFSLLNDTIQGIDETYPAWKQTAYQRKEKFPNIYRNLDNLSATIETALIKVKAGNYNISDEISYINANDLC